jgi:acetate CoA/acetoacetate CoA-transferase beta subunit
MDKTDKDYKKILIGKRIAKELQDGDYINLGIGLPTEVANHIPTGINIIFQSENGMIGVGAKPENGKEDLNLINAGGGFVSETLGCCYLDSATSFGIVRGGHLDATILGALQVDEKGNLANWMIPGKLVPGMGGAMDLVAGTKNVIVAMEHCDKDGNPKILTDCTLPLTASNKVTMIVTDMAVIKIIDQRLHLMEIAEGYTVDDIKKATEADLIISENLDIFSI